MTAPGGGTVIGQAIIRILPDVKRFARALRQQLHAASSQLKTLQRDLRPVDRALKFLARNATGIAPGIKLAAAAFRTLAAEAVVGGVVSLAGAAYELAGTLLLIPAGAVAAAAAMGALRTGLQGVSDAMKQFLKNPEKFREKVSELSTNAQKTLGVLDKMRPRILAFRDAVQDALFAGFDKILPKLANTILPILQDNFVGLTKIFNSGAKDIAAFVQKASTLEDLNAISYNITAGFQALRPAILPASQAVLDLVRVGSEFLPQIGDRVSELTTKFAEFIHQARQSGRISEWIGGGLNVLEQLGRIVLNLVVGFHSLLVTAKQSGLGLVNTIEAVSKAFRNFMTSARGQEAITQFLTNAKEAAQALLPAIGALAEVFFGHLVPALTVIGKILAPSVTQFIRALGEAIDAARPGVEQFARGFGVFIQSLIPALPAIGQLVGALGRLVGALSAGLGPAIASVVSSLASIFIPVLNTLASIVALLPEGFFKFVVVLGTIIYVINGVIGAMRGLIAFATLFATSLSVASTAAVGLTKATGAFVTFMRGPWGVALTIALALLGAFALGTSKSGQQQQELAGKAKELNQAIREQNGVITENIRQKAAQQLDESGALELAGRLGIATGTVTNAYVQQGSALEGLKTKLLGMVAGRNLAADAQNQETDADARRAVEAARLLGILNQLTGGRAADEASQRRVTEATNQGTSSIQKQIDAYYGWIDAQSAKQNQDLAGLNTQIEYQRQLAATRTELTNGTKTLNINTKEGQNNLTAVTQLAAAGQRRIAQLKAEHAPIATINAEMRNQRKAMLDLLTPFFKNRDAARAYAVQLGLIPRNINTNIVLRDAAARANLAALQRALNNLHDKTITVSTFVRGANITGGGGHQFLTNAAGGLVKRGDVSWVGERGPELVAFGRSARIFSNPESHAMLKTDDDLRRLDRMTTIEPTYGSRRQPRTATTAPAPTRVAVETRPEVHVYVGNQSVDQHIERVVVARDRQTQRIIRSRASGARS